MRFVFFCHSLVSDWNNGNAHFFRGVCTELLRRGHELRIYEPNWAWSVLNLVRDYGTAPIREFQERYPMLRSQGYSLNALDLERMLDGADIAVVHEWNDPALVRRLGHYRQTHSHPRLLFHDTHHRSISRPHEVPSDALAHYDGILAFGERVREEYLRKGWARQVWVWHEAADTRVFTPRPASAREGDVVWIGNWGDDERTAQIYEYLVEPVHELGLQARVYGVRYPADALRRLSSAGIAYGGWLPNFRVPEVFGAFAVTVHIPRRFYSEVLHGIPTIRPFEALACGIPLICAPWLDTENLFAAGADYLPVSNGAQMRKALRAVLADTELASELARHGRDTIMRRHTCVHRVDELLSIAQQVGTAATTAGAARTTAASSTR
ncbi:MAG: glycosyltransferase [Chitinivibrionales bacterium]|nr:glycosyltransferase [Chitinivibrionales bacterium]